ncbi:putative entry exclusion protein TrbK-alt [Sinorhizobium garamanticum]|uniref:Entry exclusion protein TrbK-alt n=1 Tax=Sinorhizobium garamanticum TaxID=680247 RepID=A0ABY8D4H0_9HYPH|nr:putative entry exclusion protein TrbK-alt [Sinorhizobium garamanticum]WEX85761.1 putative entry exclusion protein TrbK-alt [Sinorhizobium garamanticum]
MDGKWFARLAAVGLIAVALTATAIEMTRKEEEPETPALGDRDDSRVDPLRAELRRCAVMGEAGARDAGCLRAWAENRQRFLTPGARPTDRQVDRPAAPNTPATPAPTDVLPDNPILKETAPAIAPDASEDQ